jgi:hypothetical protein
MIDAEATEDLRAALQRAADAHIAQRVREGASAEAAEAEVDAMFVAIADAFNAADPPALEAGVRPAKP